MQKLFALLVSCGLAFAPAGALFADVVSNNLDGTVDASVESVALAVGATQNVTFTLTLENGDGDNGCNVDGAAESVTFNINGDTAAATADVPSITFTGTGGSGSGCGSKNIVVTANGVGTTHFTLSVGANNTGAGTYNLAPAAFDVTVTAPIVKQDPTVSVTNSPQVYSGAPIAAVVNGSVVGVVSDIKYDGSSTTPTNAGTYNITADFAPTDAVHYNNLNDAVAGTFVINKAPSGCVITGFTGTYDGTAHGTTGTCDGTGTLDLGASYTDVPGGSADWTYSGDTNHESDSGTVTIEISQAPSTVTVSCGGPYTYTGLAQTPCTATASGVGMTDIDVTVSIVYSDNTNAGTASADASWDGDTNHTGSVGSSSFTIDPAVLTVTVDNKSKLQGASDPAFTFQYSGFVNGETDAVVTTAPTCTVAGVHANPGDYPIVCSGAAATNYTVMYVDGTLHVFSLASVFHGFFAPVSLSLKDFQKNSTIPVKFALDGGFGRFYGGEATLQVRKQGDVSWTNAQASGGSNNGNIFRYDASAGQYIFNLSTKMGIFKAGSTYDLRIVLNGVEYQPLNGAITIKTK